MEGTDPPTGRTPYDIVDRHCREFSPTEVGLIIGFYLARQGQMTAQEAMQLTKRSLRRVQQILSESASRVLPVYSEGEEGCTKTWMILEG